MKIEYTSEGEPGTIYLSGVTHQDYIDLAQSIIEKTKGMKVHLSIDDGKTEPAIWTTSMNLPSFDG